MKKIRLQVFLLLVLIPFIHCADGDDDTTTAPVAVASDTTASVAVASDTTTPVAVVSDVAAPLAVASETVAPPAEKRRGEGKVTRGPRPTSGWGDTTKKGGEGQETWGSSTTPGWSDDNYNEDDRPYSRNRDRYNDNSYGNYGYDDDNNGYGYDDDTNNYGADNYDRSPRRKRVPDEYGNMNIYVREPAKSGKSKKYKRMRFPVNRFKPGHFPPLPPLISFLPWLPIFSDRLTKQTIIFSPTGGLYIIPPLINFYGQLFSVAELIASGYASLVSSGVPPPPAVNVAPLVAPGPVAGPGIPPVNVATGGFSGGVTSKFGAFPQRNNAGNQAPPAKGPYGR